MMEGRLLTGEHKEFTMAPWDGVNRSGWAPLDDKVLVLMDEHVEITTGGIHIPGTAAERMSLAGETGIVIALGPVAFRWNDEMTRKWEGRAPEPGERVYIERYAGQLIQGMDGRAYRLMSQRCVGALAIPAEPLPQVVVTCNEPEAVIKERFFPLPPLRGPETKPGRRRVA
jgi:chaperonin GroES